MPRTAVFTIIAKNYLPYARVLMRSLAAHHPDWTRFVILADSIDGYFDPLEEDFEVVESGDLPIPRSSWFHFKYTVLELSTALKPSAFEFLFNAHAFDRIVYLDPDIQVYSPLVPIVHALEAANLALTPHLTGPLEDDCRPSEIDILRAGVYNLGFIGIANNPESGRFLAWWRQRLYDHCLVDLPRGLFVDQRWMDFAPCLFEGVAIVRDTGCNVAYWNLSHRTIAATDRGYTAGGAVLRFFHFSGYDPEQPHSLSRHQNRHELTEAPEVAQNLVRDYCEGLLNAGYTECHRWPYAYARFRNGEPIPDMTRPLHHESPEVLNIIADPFSDEGFEASLRVWNAPVLDEVDCGGESRRGISRLTYRIYRTRTDVQSAMPDIFGGNYRRFLEWVLVSGKAEHGLGDAFLTTVKDAFRASKQESEQSAPPLASPEVALPVNTQGRVPLTRLAAAIYQSRPELQRYFPDPRGQDALRFLMWLLTYGKKEHHLSAHHVEPLKAQWREAVGALPDGSTRLWYQLNLRAIGASVFLRSVVQRLGMASLRPRKSAPAGPPRSHRTAEIRRESGRILPL